MGKSESVKNKNKTMTIVVMRMATLDEKGRSKWIANEILYPTTFVVELLLCLFDIYCSRCD